MVLIILALILQQIASSGPVFLSFGTKFWRAIAVSQFVAAVFFALIGFMQYRCPYCNEIVRGHDKYLFGLLIDPEKCPNCLKRLK